MNTEVVGYKTMSSAISEATGYTKWICDAIRPYVGSRVLEVGTGNANYREYLPNIQRFFSVDIDSHVIADAKKKDAAGEYHVADLSSHDFMTSFAARDFDTVYCLNVLEHIEADRLALKNMSNLLKERGHLIGFVPAFSELYSKMDELAGHHRRYTKKDIRQHADALGLKIELCEYFNPIGGVGWWVNKFFGHQSLDSNAINQQILFFDRYVLPISKLLNPLTKAWFGQSLLFVLRR